MHTFIKEKKLVSSALSHFGHAKLASAAGALGYGRPRKRVVHRKRGGANLRRLLSSAHKFIKDKKLVSSALWHFGHSKLASAASVLGYGRRRRRVGRPVKRRVVRRRVTVVHRRRHHGGANFFSTEQIACLDGK